LTVCAGSLNLSDNQLTGLIATEISSLANLGELIGRGVPLSFFPCKECPHEYFLGLFFCFTDDLWLFGNNFTGSYTCPDSIAECWISCDYLNDNYTNACRSL
jgi:hypothetical protein